MNVEGQEADEKVLANFPGGGCWYANADEAVGYKADIRSVSDAVLEVDADLAM